MWWLPRKIVEFWARLTEGLQLQELWRQFLADARASYGFYSREVDSEPQQSERRWRRPWRIAGALFWSLVTMLSPARRVFLLSGILLALLWSDSGIAIITLSIVLVLELADRVLMKRDLQIARVIQGWLVPSEPPRLPGIDIAFSTRPANTVAGDYYDAFVRGADGQPGDTSRLLFVVADVAGKSVPAALLMATFQSSLHALANLPGSLGELVTALNRASCTQSLGGRRFTTAFLGELDLATRALRYVCAGHNAPVLRRAAGGIERLDAGGLPFGILSDATYAVGSTGLHPGDVLVVFTDGVVEAVNSWGIQYGDDRLLHMLAMPLHLDASATLQQIMADVARYAGSAPQSDDITGLVLRLEPVPVAPVAAPADAAASTASS